MIVRMWHGIVPIHKSKDYAEFLNKRAIPDYRSIKGNLSVYILKRDEKDITHFITLTFWGNWEAIKEFAGEDVNVANIMERIKTF